MGGMCPVLLAKRRPVILPLSYLFLPPPPRQAPRPHVIPHPVPAHRASQAPQGALRRDHIPDGGEACHRASQAPQGAG